MVNYSDNFLKEAKQLSKKYKLLKLDLKNAVEEIKQKQDLGVYLGLNLYKKRVKNSSIPTGKSGGFRIIIYQQLEDQITLISIYSKTEKESLSDEELSVVLIETSVEIQTITELESELAESQSA
jgi:hypothetical protein